MKLTMRLGPRSYDIILRRGALGRVGQLVNLSRKVLVVTDSGVPQQYLSTVLAQCPQGVPVVLEQGEVKAFGSLEDIWGSSVMHPWLPPEQQSSVLKVTVLEHHPHYAMTALALGDQHLWVNRIEKPLQTALRIRIQASDVSLVLQPPLQSSIRNILRARVAQCYDDNGQVEVQLEVGSRTLWARISPWARDELAIKPGLWLYAQIKSVSITT